MIMQVYFFYFRSCISSYLFLYYVQSADTIQLDYTMKKEWKKKLFRNIYIR